MSERGRVVLIFAGVALAVGLPAFWFVKIHRPNQIREDAQDEVVAWEARWTAVRTCLLGKNPGSPKTSEALAIREMQPDLWDRGTCTPLIGKLSRGEAPDSGLPAVEAAWTALDHAAGKAATSYALHLSSSTTLTNDPLAEGLDALDAAHEALRAAAELPVVAERGRALPDAQVIELRDGTEPLTGLELVDVPSAHGLVAFGKTATHAVEVLLPAGGTPTIDQLGDGAMRSVSDPSWGARVVQGTGPSPQVALGRFDPDGGLAAGSTIVSIPKVATIAAVAGTLAKGVIVAGDPTSLAIAHVIDGNANADQVGPIDAVTAAVDLDGRVALIWSFAGADTNHSYVQLLGPNGDEPALELPAAESPSASSCLTADRAWFLVAGKALAFGGGQPLVERPVESTILLGCTRSAALLRTRDSASALEICTDACRTVKMPTGAPGLASTTVVADELVAVAAHDGVLGVWHERAGPVFYALPVRVSPVLAQSWPAMAMTDGKVIDVLARGPNGYAIIRIPTRY